MSSEYDINKVLSLLPHRYPFVLVDRITDINRGSHITCLKNVTVNEPFFVGHFPHAPVMPGVLQLEALAQAAGLLYKLSNESGDSEDILHYLAGIDNARFKRVVLPGDQLTLKVDFIKGKRDLWKLHGEASVNEELSCSADFMIVKKELHHDI